MGLLVYGTTAFEIEFDDRTLAHLQVVIVNKLRREEKFLFTWLHGPDEGGGRSSIWFHPTIPLRFHFDVADAPKLNRPWLEALVVSANSTAGLHVLAEPEDGSAPER